MSIYLASKLKGKEEEEEDDENEIIATN